jgi:hypothetical protein
VVVVAAAHQGTLLLLAAADTAASPRQPPTRTLGRRDISTSGSSSAYVRPLTLSGLSPPIRPFWLYSDSPWRVSQILRELGEHRPLLQTCVARWR